MAIDTAMFKKILEEEKARLEKELATVAHRDNGTESWEAKGTIQDESIDADPNEVADKLEEFETNRAITSSFKEELDDVNAALDRIALGTYGMCEICGKEIEEDRLKALPSARTCKAHMN